MPQSSIASWLFRSKPSPSPISANPAAPTDPPEVDAPSPQGNDEQQAAAQRLSPLPPQATLEPLTDSHMMPFQRLNALLLPIPYQNSFYKETQFDPVIASLTRIATWQSEDSQAKMSEAANSFMRDSGGSTRRLVGAIRCRLIAADPQDPDCPDRCLYISTIGTLAPFREHGIARHLLKDVMRTALKQYGVSTILAHVWEANEEALEWYKKRGFRLVRKEKGYYKRLAPRTDAWVRVGVDGWPKLLSLLEAREALQALSSLLSPRIRTPHSNFATAASTTPSPFGPFPAILLWPTHDTLFLAALPSPLPHVSQLAISREFPPNRLTLLLLGLIAALLALLVRQRLELVSQSALLDKLQTDDTASLPGQQPDANAFVCPNTRADPVGTLFDNTNQRSMSLADTAGKVAATFTYGAADLNAGVKEFLKQMDDGLSKVGTTLQQIPTYVTSVPNGTEKGLYMAVDLGGTNFRVCSIQLHGNTTFSLAQSKVPIPRELMVAKTSKELFSFLAKQIENFLKTHHNEHYTGHMERRASNVGGFHDEEVFSMGFTFSFPVHQVGINRGTLIRWTKGFDIADAVGKDVCEMLQTEIDALGLPVKVAALVNDTVGTLMARSYTSPGKSGTLLGAIFGTGTNGAYVEKLARIKKLKTMQGADAYDTSTGEMIINSEWGSFDNGLHVLPNTPYDAALDAESNNPGLQMFEKRVSGMFLGEILRRAVVNLVEDSSTPLFEDASSQHNDLHSTTNIASDSALFVQWGLDTAFLSIAHGDTSEGLRLTRQALDKDLGISAASSEDAEAVKTIATAIGRRAARLSAVAIGAVVLASGKLETASKLPDGAPVLDGQAPSTIIDPSDADVVDVGVDGSLVEFYPGFEGYMREALREIDGIGPVGEQKIRIGIAKDGSGVGAALIALVAEKMGVSAPTEK